MIQLDLSSFKPTTLLSRWWQELGGIFGQLEEAHNTLEAGLAEETANRVSDKNELTELVETQAQTRRQAEENLAGKITAEELSRKNADSALSQKITDKAEELDSKISGLNSSLGKTVENEAEIRASGDAALDSKISALRSLSHRHTNYELMEGISDDDVNMWRTFARQKTDDTVLHDYFDEMFRDFSLKVNALYAAMGMTVYDGGIDGQISDEAGIDGGEMGVDEETGIVDFGGFESLGFDVSGQFSAAVLDGGTY